MTFNLSVLNLVIFGKTYQIANTYQLYDNYIVIIYNYYALYRIFNQTNDPKPLKCNTEKDKTRLRHHTAGGYI